MAVTLNSTGNSNGFILCSDNTGAMLLQTVGSNSLFISNTQVSTFSSQGNANVVTISGIGINVTGTFYSTSTITAGAVTYANTDGTANQVLTTYGNGITYWSTVSGNSISNGNSNVSIPAANGNVNISVAGNANILVITGTGANITGTANITGNANVGNLGVAQILASANITAPQIISNISTGTAPLVVTSTTVVANLNANALQGNTPNESATANSIVQRNADGNITANFFIGNGSQLTGLSTNSISNGNSNVVIATAGGNVDFYINGNATSKLSVNANSLTGTFTSIQLNLTNSSSLSFIANTNVIDIGSGGTSKIANGTYVISLGRSSKANGDSTIAIGYLANAQGNTAISIGERANALIGNGIAIGNSAKAQISSGAIAIGQNSAANGSPFSSIAIGPQAFANGSSTVVLGPSKWANGQGAIGIGSVGNANGIQSINLGHYANSNGDYSIGIGSYANASNIATIVINATGNELTPTGSNGFYVKPIKNANTSNVLYYNNTTGEITFDTLSGGSNIANGNSNVSIPAANGNVNISAIGNANILVVTGTGANITGTANITGNANVGNLGAAQVLASANITAPQLISNISTGTAPLVVTSTTVVANLNANALQGNTPSESATANSIVQRNTDGNITANFFIGNGSQLTGLSTSSISNGNSNVSIPAANGNVNISAVGNANILVVTGTGANITGTANITGNANVGNIGVAQVLATANITAPQIISNISTGTAPLVVTSTTVVANLNSNALQGNTPSESATANSIVQRNTDGNITANFFIGNGSQLTGLPSGTAISNGNSNVNIPAANGNVNISAVGNANILVITGTGANITGTANITGNANVGNIGGTGGVFTTVAGTLTTAAQPNITSVGTLTSLTATGNISGNYIIGNGSSLTGVAFPAIESVTVLTGSTGTVTHNYNLGGVFVHTSISSNFTAAFANVPTTNNNVVSFTLVLVQGATPYLPTAVTINGSSVTVGYVGGVSLSGTANKTDIVVYAFFRVNNAWAPLTGALTSYG